MEFYVNSPECQIISANWRKTIVWIGQRRLDGADIFARGDAAAEMHARQITSNDACSLSSISTCLIALHQRQILSKTVCGDDRAARLCKPLRNLKPLHSDESGGCQIGCQTPPSEAQKPKKP